MKKKSLLIATIILMSIRFAAISITLIINGSTTISENKQNHINEEIVVPITLKKNEVKTENDTTSESKKKRKSLKKKKSNSQQKEPSKKTYFEGSYN